MTTDTDIVNRSLQLIGTRTNIASLAESSNEAIQANVAYSQVRDWCLGAANWNFARKTVALATARDAILPPTVWTSGQPAPPWLHEYLLPSDFIRAIYLTNSGHTTNANFDGELQRFVIATDVLTGVQKTVLLTNSEAAILVYTYRATDPTLWPWMFERFMVSALAWTLCQALTGLQEQTQYLDGVMTRFFSMAEQANREEGLSFGDSTPEWIQAIGIDYPYRRRGPPGQGLKGQADDNKR